MRILAKPGAVAAAVIGLTLAGAGALSASAQAAPYDQVECTNSGNATGYSAFCYLTVSNGASNEAWTFNGYAYPAANGHPSMRHSCAPQGSTYTVSVTYVDNSGVTSTESTVNTCGGINQ